MAFQAGSKTESGYLAVPPSGSGPGVLVVHAWWGLNDFFVGLCDRLAGEGFVALAPDLYEGAVAVTQDEADRLSSSLDPEATKAKLFQALDALQQSPALQGYQVGTVGCSLGAFWSLRLAAARPDDIAATVIFYGLADVDGTSLRPAYLGHFAENDTWEPLEQVKAMEAELHAAGKDATIYVYPGVGHWFFEEDQPEAFDAASAQLAWTRTVAFLRNHLRGTP